MKNNTLLGDISKAMHVMSDEEKSHFNYLVQRLLRCYTHKNQRAAIFMQEDDADTATLTCVNADDKNLYEMVHYVNEFIGAQNTFRKIPAMSLH